MDIINDSSDDEDRHEGNDENTIRSASNPGNHDVPEDSNDTDVDANEFEDDPPVVAPKKKGRPPGSKNTTIKTTTKKQHKKLIIFQLH